MPMPPEPSRCERRGPMEGTSTRAEIEAFLSRQTPKELGMSRNILADLPRRRANGERVGHHLGLLGASDGDRGRLAPGQGGRSAGPDRGHLQPGEPGGRLHRHDPRGLPRLRRGDRRQGRLRPRRPDPRRRSSRAEPVEAPAARRGVCARPHHGGGIRAGRLHQDPPRHQHGVRRRERRASRRTSPPSVPPSSRPPPRRPSTSMRSRRRSTSSAPRCRSRAARWRRWTICR